MYQLLLLGTNVFKLDTKTGDTWVLYGTNWVKLVEVPAV